ncbi:uncharacterized protein LOC119603544 isoform X2 [Lucilia sericata]|uniref:uncharacterized protein LOC119603544 isoform X2 n=1 Tax=Lucilia sericata TaxID=13632 RepID=UPI0018A82F08|nr:uncharacterized protein LOC119603544 isoform X2 [Lucilia sericata]
MPIQLDKILGDIANEKVLHPNYQGATKKEIDDAWTRVGKNSNLSVHESRSIFKVLQKKYEQEKLKDSSAWKLFGLMDQIHKKVEPKVDEKEDEPNAPMEEDEEYEMLEVQEDEDNGQAGHSEKEDKPVAKTLNRQQTTPTSNAHHQQQADKTPSTKLLNTLAAAANTPKSNTNMATPQTPSATAAALQKKGITMKKTTGNQQGRSLINQNLKQQQAKITGRTAANAGAMHGLEVGKTIQLPDSLKRKLSEDQPSTPQTKRANQQSTPQSSSNSASPSAKSASPHRQQHTTTAQLLQLKQDRNDQQQSTNVTNATNTSGINLITIPANPTATGLVNGLISSGGGGPSSSTAATVASTASTNGFSPRIEEIDFRNDIIFDANSGVNGTALAGKVANSSEIINLGNFDNSLPPTFFKNLCNSSRHEALGLYVANVMNRLRPRSAAKLEVGILRAILDIQSEELEQ